MSEFARNQHKKGSKVKINNTGDRGQLWPVQFQVENAFNKRPLTWTFAVGSAYRDMMKLIRQLPRPNECKTASR